MLDENMKVEKREKKEYPNIPKDIYQAELLDITLKDAKGKYADKGEKNFAFQFTILKGRDESQEKDENKELRGRNLWDNFINTYLYIGKNGKNSLYKVVEAFLGRELTREEEAEGITGSMLNKFIGKQCRVSVEGKQSGKKVYDNIVDYLKATEQLTPLTDEEKETATVNSKDGESKSVDTSDQNDQAHKEDEINIEDLPFGDEEVVEKEPPPFLK